ncbi:MAG: hypothetical protein CSA20_01850 [Deltaproteobacteria bacterium]|nr:MAG: hypothetical protein CSA20_01850 [Deltaproteobacteria bacterium]
MSIHADHRNGNLHIKLNGSFTTDSAAKLTMIMLRSYQGKGNIFIHTDEISSIDPSSKCAFNELIRCSALPGKNIYLMGAKGLAICHDTGKVIVRKQRPKGRRCGQCSCKCKTIANNQVTN